MNYYKDHYISLMDDHEGYKSYMEAQLEKAKKRNIELEKDMDVLTNIIQISQYINSNIQDKNLVNMINDMIVGVLGVKHSCIYIKESNGELVRGTNEPSICDIEPTEEELGYIKSGVGYLFKGEKYRRKCSKCKAEIKSSMGIPIKLREKFIGYIVVVHEIDLTEENRIFLSAISVQIAIALENSLLYRELSSIAKLDPLMGIYNRKYFFKRVEELVLKTENYAIIMLDLDNFKKINDTYGHQYGDEVLKEVSKIISLNLIDKSIFARYGGEEIIVFIYDYTNEEEIIKNLDEIRSIIENKVVSLGDIKLNVTISIGIAFKEFEHEQLSKIISRADKLLYAAKRSGKNKVVYK